MKFLFLCLTPAPTQVEAPQFRGAPRFSEALDLRAVADRNAGDDEAAPLCTKARHFVQPSSREPGGERQACSGMNGGMLHLYAGVARLCCSGGRR